MLKIHEVALRAMSVARPPPKPRQIRPAAAARLKTPADYLQVVEKLLKWAGNTNVTEITELRSDFRVVWKQQ
jgi:hypothetical protein